MENSGWVQSARSRLGVEVSLGPIAKRVGARMEKSDIRSEIIKTKINTNSKKIKIDQRFEQSFRSFKLYFFIKKPRTKQLHKFKYFLRIGNNLSV